MRMWITYPEDLTVPDLVLCNERVGWLSCASLTCEAACEPDDDGCHATRLEIEDMMSGHQVYLEFSGSSRSGIKSTTTLV
jgi:hypothetical protein